VVVTFYGFQEQVKELQLRHAAEAGPRDGLASAPFPKVGQMKHGEPLRFSGAKPFKFPERSRGATGQKSPWPVKKLGRKP